MNQIKQKLETLRDDEELTLDFEQKEFEGIVCIVDALGSRNFTIEESLKTMSKLQGLHEAAVYFCDPLHEKVRKMSSSKSIDVFTKMIPSIFTFGDTLLFAWPVERDNNWTEMIDAFLYWACCLMTVSISSTLPLRGSFTYGKYLVDEDRNMVLGPAITDAAGWYDKAQWLGIHSTPHMNLEMRANISEEEKGRVQFAIPYKVPFKDEMIESWCVKWPTIRRELGESRAKETVLNSLAQFHFGPHDTSKYLNTLSFVDMCFSDSNEL